MSRLVPDPRYDTVHFVSTAEVSSGMHADEHPFVGWISDGSAWHAAMLDPGPDACVMSVLDFLRSMKPTGVEIEVWILSFDIRLLRSPA